MMSHLGGPESHEKIIERHRRYCSHPICGLEENYAITVNQGKTTVGWVGYWEKEWKGLKVLETGWMVLPEYWGQGIATMAMISLIRLLIPKAKYRYLHAFPSIENPSSNAICRKLNFELLGIVDFEYPKGKYMQCNDWMLDLQHSNAYEQEVENSS